MDKAKGGRIKGGRQGWVGHGEGVGGKWRQLYLNNNRKKIIKTAISLSFHVRIKSVNIYNMLRSMSGIY